MMPEKFIVIGGTGGSGTRAITHALSKSGLFVGSSTNISLDSLPFSKVLDSYINVWLNCRSTETMDQFPMSEFLRDWSDARDQHLHGFSGDVWVAKNPRTIILLQLLFETFSGMHFVHVIRHGASMALSDNQRQLNLHGDYIIKNSSKDDLVSRSLELWAKINMNATRVGSIYKSRYSFIKYEDFCEDPVREIARLATELKIEIDYDLIDSKDYIPAIRDYFQVHKRNSLSLSEYRHVFEAYGYIC